MSAIFPEYTQKRSTDFLQVSEVKTISPPNCKWYRFDNYDLSRIPKMFTPATFQRKHSTTHVYRIVESMVNNKFYDNTIRCVKLSNGKYEVIDGQHRLQALWILYKQYGVKKYSIVMQYFSDTEAREVFRKINSGRKLTTVDYLKTLDDGTYPFFDEIRDYATHKISKNYIGYLKLLSALNYQRKVIPQSLPIHTLEDILISIEADDMAHMYRIANATYDVYDMLKSNRVFSQSTISPLFLIGFKNNYSKNEYAQHLKKIITSDQIADLQKQSFRMTHKKILVLMEQLTIGDDSQ